jgi:hypothetical protein
MKCPNCYYENQRNKNVCENCGSDLHPPQPLPAADPSLTPGMSQVPRSKATHGGGSRLLRGIGRFFNTILSFILYVVVLIICAAAILFVLLWQCRVNWPIAPNWEFLPKVAVHYWNWLDGWQMTRCPDLTPGNYFFGDEPVPVFDESGAQMNGSQCGNAVISFSPQSAPAGTTLDISLDGFMPEETVEACWYYPSNALENCLDLMTDADGNAETVYLSSTNHPRGTYRMEVEDTCGQYSQEFCLD